MTTPTSSPFPPTSACPDVSFRSPARAGLRTRSDRDGQGLDPAVRDRGGDQGTGLLRVRTGEEDPGARGVVAAAVPPPGHEDVDHAVALAVRPVVVAGAQRVEQVAGGGDVEAAALAAQRL